MSKGQIRKSIKSIVSQARSSRSNSAKRPAYVNAETSPIRLAQPVGIPRSKTPNDTTWRKIHNQFKRDDSWRRSLTPSNRSLSNISQENLRSFRLRKTPEGKIKMLPTPKVESVSASKGNLAPSILLHKL